MKRDRRVIAIFAVVVAVAASAAGASMTGGDMGGGGIVVASDGSLVIPIGDMMSSDMGSDGSGMNATAELMNVGADGRTRWRIELEGGMMMAPGANGDLIVAAEVIHDDMGGGGMGGGDMSGSGEMTSQVVGIDLATGAIRWTTPIDSGVAMHISFAPDGSRIYVEAAEMSMDGDHGSASKGQPASEGGRWIYALDRTGHVLWKIEVSSSDGGHMGTAAAVRNAR